MADQAIEANVKSIDFAKQLVQAKADSEGGNKPIPAIAKPTPDMSALNLDAITAELWAEKNDPENVQLREEAGESHRIIEVVRSQHPQPLRQQQARQPRRLHDPRRPPAR